MKSKLKTKNNPVLKIFLTVICVFFLFAFGMANVFVSFANDGEVPVSVTGSWNIPSLDDDVDNKNGKNLQKFYI